MTNETETTKTVDEWGIVELFGHIRIAGRISEVERYGGKMLRLDIPDNGEFIATQLIGCAAIYRLTLCTEETARRAAAVLGRADPVTPWALREIQAALEVSDSELVDADVDDPW